MTPTQRENARLPLRRRLFLAMSAMLFAALAAASIGFYFMAEKLETTVLSVFLEQEMAVIRQHLAEDPRQSLPRISSLYVFREGDPELPTAVAELPLGQHHDIRIGDDRYEVLIDTVDRKRIWLLFDIDAIEKVADVLFFLIGLMFVTLTAFSAWLSYRIARRISSPIGRLADRVETLTPGDSGVRLAQDFRGEEVERIAGAFDRYLERIEGFVEREQAFTASASHELRTPLAVILGASELLAETAEGPRERKALARIRRAGHEMQEFIDALLSLSREEAAAGSFSAEVRVDEIARRLCDEFKETLNGDTRLDFRCDCLEPLRVTAPASLIVIALGNLIRNAIQNTPKGSIEVRTDHDGVTVRDTGRGMSKEVQAQVFDRHFSASGSSGMGLYLVKRIADRYGWQIRISSQQGEGTTISLAFGR